jgi:hypothetical protein
LRSLKSIIRSNFELQKKQLFKHEISTAKAKRKKIYRKCNPFHQSRPKKKVKKLSTFEEIYQEQINDTPIFDFSICQRTFFKKYVVPMKQIHEITNVFNGHKMVKRTIVTFAKFVKNHL